MSKIDEALDALFGVEGELDEDGFFKDTPRDIGDYYDCVVKSDAKKISALPSPKEEKHIKADNSNTDNSTIDSDSQAKTETKITKTEKETMICDVVFHSLPPFEDKPKEKKQEEKKQEQEKQEEEKPKKDIPTESTRTRDELPTCPVNLRLPENFKIDHFGIWRKKKMIGKNAGKENKYYTDRVSNTPMVITKLLVDVDTKEESVEIARYKFATNKWIGGIIAPVADIANNIKCCALSRFGLDITQTDAKYISKYLMSMLREPCNERLIPTSKIHNFPGWIDDDCTQFLYPSDDNNGENHLRITSQEYVGKFKAHGDFNLWKEKIIKLYKQVSPVFRIVFGTVIAAPLMRILRVRNQQLLLWCKTGSGKSAVCKAAMSAFGVPERLKYTFNSTRRAIDQLSTSFCDLPQWIDELQVAEFTRDWDKKDNPIYNFAERKIRARCYCNGKLQEIPKEFYGTRVMTGEQPILQDSSNAGAYNRVLQISESKIFDDNINPRQVHNFFDENHGHFGKIWIDFIRENKKEIIAEYKRNLREFERVADKEEFLSNWDSCLAAICTALQFAIHLIGGESTNSVFNDFYDDVQKIINDIPRKTTAQNWQRALSNLQDYVASHPRNFLYEIQTEAGIAPYLGYPTGMLAGNVVHGVIYNDTTVAFYPSELRNILERELRFPNAKSIIRDFAENGVLDLPNKETPKHPYQKSMRLQNIGAKWIYMFNAKILLDEDSANDYDPLDD